MRQEREPNKQTEERRNIHSPIAAFLYLEVSLTPIPKALRISLSLFLAPRAPVIDFVEKVKWLKICATHCRLTRKGNQMLEAMTGHASIHHRFSYYKT
jgi:hypothetical protein